QASRQIAENGAPDPEASVSRAAKIPGAATKDLIHSPPRASERLNLTSPSSRQNTFRLRSPSRRTDSPLRNGLRADRARSAGCADSRRAREDRSPASSGGEWGMR